MTTEHTTLAPNPWPTLRDSEPDGPIREPGDDIPRLSDDEIVDALNLHAAKAMRLGDYGAHTDISLAADRIEELSEQVSTAREVVGKLTTEIANTLAIMRDKDWIISNLRVEFDLLRERFAALEKQL